MKSLLQILFVCSALALFSCSAQAIVNVEQAIIGHDTDGVHTTLGLLASGANGNSIHSKTKADLLTLWQHEKNSEFLQMQYANGQSQGQVDTDNAFIHLRHRSDITDSLGIEGFAQVGQDHFARLSRRTLIGTGLRWVVFENDKKSAAYIGTGIAQEQETLSPVAGINDLTQKTTWRATTYLVLKRQYNDMVRLNSATFYQPSIANADDFRLLEQASLLVKLDDHLDLKINLDISFDSMPPQTVQKHDLLYSTGLEYKF